MGVAAFHAPGVKRRRVLKALSFVLSFLPLLAIRTSPAQSSQGMARFAQQKHVQDTRPEINELGVSEQPSTVRRLLE